ncbi:MAG: LysE family translocator [Burkholderiales bacterium]|nr:MAG: LysE family translocator [Burkholderiales bacterium]
MLNELGIHNLWLFILAGWALNLTPGPDVFFQITQALKGGLRAGIAAMLGVCAGCLVHVAAASLGVSALIAASSTAFTVLKWIGAAYLVYVGIQMLRTQPTQNAMNSEALCADSMPASGQKSLSGIFIQGFWTNALNPKVALFFLAFLPQFITPQATQPALAFAALGLLFILNSVPINLGYVLLAAWVSQRMGSLQRGLVWLERAAGALFVGFGIKLAFSEK